MRYLGIDYGTKKIGLALSDESGAMGFPHSIVSNDHLLLPTLLALIQERQVGGIVMGESLAFDGSENPVAHEAKVFAEELTRASGIAVSLEPEMLTTREARRMQEPSEKTRKPQDRSHVDASAAALILTSYLSKHPSL